jgi:hypothetical protein
VPRRACDGEQPGCPRVHRCKHERRRRDGSFPTIGHAVAGEHPNQEPLLHACEYCSDGALALCAFAALRGGALGRNRSRALLLLREVTRIESCHYWLQQVACALLLRYGQFSNAADRKPRANVRPADQRSAALHHTEMRMPTLRATYTLMRAPTHTRVHAQTRTHAHARTRIDTPAPAQIHAHPRLHP